MAVLLDPPDEGWRSMELVGEQLVRELELTRHPFRPLPVVPRLPRLARRVPGAATSRRGLNVDRLLGRFVTYPVRAAFLARRATVFHVVDHSYSQLLHVLPAARTGVFCHDLDTFRCLLPGGEPRSRAFKAMVATTLAGLRKAGVVFHSTRAVREELLRHRLVAPERLVHAPYGVADDFLAPVSLLRDGPPDLRALDGARYLLHVGSSAPRKRLDVLFAVAGRLRRRLPDLRLVQVGAELGPQEREWVRTHGLEGALLQPQRLPTRSLATLYAHAALTLVTSEAEGFGLPVIEALAAGSPLVASDIPVLREVGGAEVRYCQVGDVEGWVHQCSRLLDAAPNEQARSRRRAHGAGYSWRAHAETIAEAYQRLLSSTVGATRRDER